MEFIGLDLGTSFVKSAVLDLEGNAIRAIRKTKPADFLPNANPLVRELDVDRIVDCVADLIAERIDESVDVRGVVFSTQMHGFVLTDLAGNLLTDYVTWLDERATEPVPGGEETYLDLAVRRTDPGDVVKSGMRMKPGLPIGNLFHWMMHNAPEGRIRCHTLGDYVISKLTGSPSLCHPTNGAATGIMDLDKGSWNEGIVRSLGFENIEFPGIVEEGTCCGIFRLRGRDIPLYVAMGDHQCALLGAMIRPGTDISINIGTGSQLSILGDVPRYGDHETRPFFANRYLKSITHIPAGRALDVLVRFFLDAGKKVYGLRNVDEGEVWKNILESLNGMRRTDLKLDISFFKGSVLPYGGAISNINESNFYVEHLFLGAFRNMAENYRSLFPRISAGEDRLERIVVSGGVGRRSPLLRDLISEAFGLPVELSLCEEEALAGLFQVALKASGMCRNTDEALTHAEKLRILG